jgi:hypothetical protein
MKPKLKRSTLTTISLRDWNSFIKEVYGKPYSFQQQEGCRSKGYFYIHIPEFPPEEKEDYGYEYDPATPEKSLQGVPLDVWLARDPNLPFNGQEYDIQLEFWWHRNFYPWIEELCDDLSKKNLLEPGDYAIIIDW